MKEDAGVAWPNRKAKFVARLMGCSRHAQEVYRQTVRLCNRGMTKEQARLSLTDYNRKGPKQADRNSRAFVELDETGAWQTL